MRDDVTFFKMGNFMANTRFLCLNLSSKVFPETHHIIRLRGEGKNLHLFLKHFSELMVAHCGVICDTIDCPTLHLSELWVNLTTELFVQSVLLSHKHQTEHTLTVAA